MVVRFHFEHNRPAIAYIHHTGVLSGAEDDMRPAGREPFEVFPGAFIGAMLAPHYGENAKLNKVRNPVDKLNSVVEFLVTQPVTFNLPCIKHSYIIPDKPVNPHTFYPPVCAGQTPAEGGHRPCGGQTSRRVIANGNSLMCRLLADKTFYGKLER